MDMTTPRGNAPLRMLRDKAGERIREETVGRNDGRNYNLWGRFPNQQTRVEFLSVLALSLVFLEIVNLLNHQGVSTVF